MILSNTNNGYQSARKMLAVPLTLLIFCACSLKSKDEEEQIPVSMAKADTVEAISQNDTVFFVSPEVKTELEKSKKSLPDYNEIFTKVEIESSYPNGPKAWQRYLNRTFKYPLQAQEQEIKGTVIVQFMVDKEGNLSDVQAIAGPEGGGLKEEAVRVIRESGKWLPAVQNGRKVKAYKKQPITFKMEQE